MPPQSPSIQSFFQASKPAAHISLLSTSPGNKPGNGFTNEEVDAVLHPTIDDWLPSQDYEKYDIASIMSVTILLLAFKQNA
jgi:hypothetical protein